MATITDKLNQLETDRQTLVDNLETKGITGLTGDETFTELVPEVLNISGGGSTPTGSITINDNGTVNVTNYASAIVNVPVVPTTYIPAGYTAFTLATSNWNGNSYSIDVSSYTVDTNNIAIVMTPNSASANTIKVVEAGLAIVQSSASQIIISAVNVPTSDIQVAIFGVTSA